MTVIAWDGFTLAADKLCVSGRTRGTVTKIHRVGKELVGVTGDLDIGMEVLAWYQAGAAPEKFPASNRSREVGSSLVVVREDGSLWKYESTPFPFPVEAPCAFGCGDEPALAAMLCGKTAREAIAIATQVNSGCGNGMDALTLATSRVVIGD